MRRGFTMIELIFVIVILGILAAVAIPRLAATRDDARLAALKTDIGTAINAVPAWYQGQRDARITEAMQLDTNQWVQTAATEMAYTLTLDAQPCVTIAVFDQNLSTGAGLGTVAVIGTDINATNGYWLSNATFDPVFKIMKGALDRSYTGTTICDTLWDDLGVTEANITMAGKKVVW